MPLVQPARAAEEQAVPGHGVVDAGPGQDQPVVAAEGGDDDGDRHDRRARRSEDHPEGRGRHPVVRRVLDLRERQRTQVGDVREDVEPDHQDRAGGERERDVALGFLTSPAVKVMLFQASEEKSDPTWATQKATNRPMAPCGGDRGKPPKSGRIGAASTGSTCR